MTPAAGSGPNQRFNVSPVGAGSTTITVTDTRGQTATVTVNVAPSGALSVNPGSLVFDGAGAGAQTFDASEANYTGPIFANGCNGVATVSPRTGNGQSQRFTVTPTAAGTCTITVTDNHGGVQTVSVTIYGPLTVNPASLTFNAIGEQQPLSASEAFYTGGFTVDAAACAGIATVSGSSPSFTVTAVGSGSCDLTVRDNHNGSRAVHVTVLAPGPLSVNPNPIAFTDVGPSNAADVTVSESHYVGAFSVTNNTCSAIATIGSPSSGGPTATISVTPLSTPSGGTCTFDVADDHGGRVTETVTVGPFGPVSPNPNSFNISVGQTVPLTITESNYTGRFTQTGCAGIAKLSGTRPNYTIMGLAPGTCTFTISDDHGQSASISVTVTAVLTVNPTSVTVSTGTSATFTASDPSCAPGDTVTATSADVTIAVVTPVGPQDCSAGPVTFTVTGVSPTPAQTTISVTDTKGGSASVGVGVNGPPPAAAKRATRASHPIVAPNGPRKPLPQRAPAGAPLVVSMPAVNLMERGPAQSIDVSESAYAGAFRAQSSDPSALSVTPQCGGPICSLRVTPLKEGAGTIRISDDRGSVRTIGFSVTAAKPTGPHATPPRPPMPLPSPPGAAPAPRPKPTPSPPH
ncbi:MAG: hypothetical protein M3T49_10215 [Candidatus Eremiobacteraeota bacterium]|nr:hypothetical protein [Candidatus Eremiobacteraeota bacterium]